MTNQKIGDDDSEDPGKSTISSDIIKDNWDHHQEVLHLGALGQVIMHFKGSTAKVTEPCRYFHCTPSASKFPKSTSTNGTTTAQTPKGIPPQLIIQVGLCTIRPSTGTCQQFKWKPAGSTMQGL
jgi:hypothetical protein